MGDFILEIVPLKPSEREGQGVFFAPDQVCVDAEKEKDLGVYIHFIIMLSFALTQS